MFYRKHNKIFILDKVIYNDEKQCYEIKLRILTLTFAPKKTSTPPYTIQTDRAFIYVPSKEELDMQQAIFYYKARFNEIIEAMCNENRPIMRVVDYGRSSQYVKKDICYSDDERRNFVFYRRQDATYGTFCTKAHVYLEVMRSVGEIDEIEIVSSYENDGTVQHCSYSDFFSEIKEKIAVSSSCVKA